MSYATQRSRNGSLADGATDSSYKKRNPNRGGFVETTTEEARQGLNEHLYGIAEDWEMPLPDGTTRHSTGDVKYHSAMKHQG